MKKIELTSCDIEVLTAFRNYLKRKNCLYQWKANTFEGYPKISMIELGKIMVDRANNSNNYYLFTNNDHLRMLKLIKHAKTSFNWFMSKEGDLFWRDIMLKFEDDFCKKHNMVFSWD